MSKYNAKASGGFRSQLEEYAAWVLTEAGISYSYEPCSIELMPATVYEGRSYERKVKKFVESSKKIRAITYTPDFVGLDWIMEVKGMRTPDFNIKWKLFKNLLKEKGALYTLLMPTTKKEVNECVTLIKENRGNGKDQGIFLLEGSIKLPSWSIYEPQIHEVNHGREGGGSL